MASIEELGFISGFQSQSDLCRRGKVCAESITFTEWGPSSCSWEVGRTAALPGGRQFTESWKIVEDGGMSPRTVSVDAFDIPARALRGRRFLNNRRPLFRFLLLFLSFYFQSRLRHSNHVGDFFFLGGGFFSRAAFTPLPCNL